MGRHRARGAAIGNFPCKSAPRRHPSAGADDCQLIRGSTSARQIGSPNAINSDREDPVAAPEGADLPKKQVAEHFFPHAFEKLFVQRAQKRLTRPDVRKISDKIGRYRETSHRARGGPKAAAFNSEGRPSSNEKGRYDTHLSPKTSKLTFRPPGEARLL